MTDGKNSLQNGKDTDDFAPIEVSEIDLYEKREKIYTRRIEGFFQRLRQYTGWPLLAGYFLLPWLEWDGRQAVLFDLPARQFHVLGITFWPQDLNMLAWVLIIAAFTLFVATALFGRVWCGYTCPQTVWTSMYMWIEQKVEGTRNQRIRLDAQPLSIGKALKKTLKHGLWLALAFYTGFTFVGYFTPVYELGWDFYNLSLHPWAAFWVAFFTLATYLNAGWMREQVCLYMCPYARFQSVMFDRDTLVISYDNGRGEPRGSRRRDADPKALGLGDCIDCELCVQVCPTGIDIRNGLQYECIGCALCVDACNSVMNKMGYEPGLIRYTTENALAGKPSRLLRPKVIGYLLVLIAMIAVLMGGLLLRSTLEVSVIRDRQQLFVEQRGGLIENRYEIKIANKSAVSQRYQLRVDGLEQHALQGTPSLVVKPGEVDSLKLNVVVPRAALSAGNTTFEFVVTPESGEELRVESRFLGPQVNP